MSPQFAGLYNLNVRDNIYLFISFLEVVFFIYIYLPSILFYYYHYLLFCCCFLFFVLCVVDYGCRYRFSQFFFRENDEDTILFPSSGVIYSEKEFSRELQGKKPTSGLLRLYLQSVPSPDKGVGLCQASPANVKVCRIY